MNVYVLVYAWTKRRTSYSSRMVGYCPCLVPGGLGLAHFRPWLVVRNRSVRACADVHSIWAQGGRKHQGCWVGEQMLYVSCAPDLRSDVRYFVHQFSRPLNPPTPIRSRAPRFALSCWSWGRAPRCCALYRSSSSSPWVCTCVCICSLILLLPKGHRCSAGYLRNQRHMGTY